MALSLRFRFLGPFWQENGRGRRPPPATLAPEDPWLKNPTNKLAHVGVLLGHVLSQNHAPEISDPGPPLKFA